MEEDPLCYACEYQAGEVTARQDVESAQEQARAYCGSRQVKGNAIVDSSLYARHSNCQMGQLEYSDADTAVPSDIGMSSALEIKNWKKENRNEPVDTPCRLSVSSSADVPPGISCIRTIAEPERSNETIHLNITDYGSIDTEHALSLDQNAYITCREECVRFQSKDVPKRNKDSTWTGYAVLLVMLFAVSSQGAAIRWLSNVSTIVSMSWLMQSQTLFLIPLFVVQFSRMSENERASLFEISTWRLLLQASVCQVCWAFGFSVAIGVTSLFHAWTLSNIHTVIIASIRILQFERSGSREVPFFKKLGLLYAIIGVLLLQISAIANFNRNAFSGNVLAAGTSAFAIGYLHKCKQLSSVLPLFLVMAPLSVLNALLFSLIAMSFEGASFTVSDKGLFGYLSSSRIAYGFYLGGVVGILGNVSCVFALQMVSQVIVSGAQTLVPVFGTFIAILAGKSLFPDLLSSVGGVLIIAGTFSIVGSL